MRCVALSIALLITLLLLIDAPAADARYCNSPNCAMCNRIFGPMQGYSTQGYSQGYSSQGYTVVQSKPVKSKPVEKGARVIYSEDLLRAVKSLPSKPTFDPTPTEVVSKVFQLAKPQRGEVVYDLGCGDARILIEAARSYGCGGVGIEIDAATAELAQRRVNETGYSRYIRISNRDATKVKLDKGDVIYMYLYPPVIRNLHRTLAGARIVISYNHDIPQLNTRTWRFVANGRYHTLYYWVNPDRDPL